MAVIKNTGNIKKHIVMILNCFFSSKRGGVNMLDMMDMECSSFLEKNMNILNFDSATTMAMLPKDQAIFFFTFITLGIKAAQH